MPPKGRPRRKSVAPPIKAEIEPPSNSNPSSSPTLTPPPPPPDVPVLAKHATVVNDDDVDNKIVDDADDGKAKKKVVKKTIKVVKKVIKKVPKKKPSGIDSNTSESCKDSNFMNSEVELKNNRDDSKDKVEEKKGDKEVQGESVAIQGTDLIEGEETLGDSGKEGEGEGEGEKGAESQGEDEDEDEVGEGKLLRGELGAMERKKRRKKEVFIGRLDKDVKEEDVRNVFEKAGEIVGLRLLTNSKTGKKFAFVRYACAEDAQRALEKFAKVEICGKECGATPVEGNDTIFLGNVDKKWKDKDVVQLLEKIGIGKIDNVTVMVDPENTECNRGFAFVEFETINDAQVAYTKLQEKDVLGKNKKIKVAWAEPLRELDEKEMLKVKTVYAEFIPSSWDEEKVKDAFKRFGEIDDIVLARNLRTSKRKDFAFVSYKTRAAAIKCIESFGHDPTDENGTKINVKVSLAKPKSKSKKIPAAKPFAKEIPRANAHTSHYKVWPTEPRNRLQSSVPHFGIGIPEASPTNVELVRLLREQASWKPPHTSLSNSSIDIHPLPLSGRKRQFSVLEPNQLYEGSNRYRHSRLDASSSAARSSHNLVHPSGLTSPMAYHQQHSGYPSGSIYEARNFTSNAEIRGKAHESRFPYHRY